MQYPKLKKLNTSREFIDVFRGYNHNLRIGENEFFDMKNLSADNYPILSPRAKRGTYETPLEPTGLIAKTDLCYTDGEAFVRKKADGTSVGTQMGLSNAPKTLISMGAYVIIMPDKKYINTEDPTDNGDIEATFESVGNTKFSLCRVDGTAYGEPSIQAEAPEDPENMELWIDTSVTPHQLKQYSSTTETWATIATTYVKIEADGIDDNFEVNDGVTITGAESVLPDITAATIIWAKGEDYIVVTGLIDEVVTIDTAVTVKRQMPLMDHIIESGNRLWGCRYCKALNDERVNEIYASKLGDFKNWNCFMGISTDSYAVSVGTDGAFTGAITHLGYPLFFKENVMHKVYGNYPANYQVQATECRGVQQGCEKSLAIVNEILFYKSRSGVCAYDGSLPQEISPEFGDLRYSDAVAGVLGNKYYISMLGEDNAHCLFVYDLKKGLWHKEDDTQATVFATWQGDLFYIDYGDKQIKSVRGSGAKEHKEVAWEAETGIIGISTPDKKYISRMDVRMQLAIGTRVIFSAEYDSSGVWEPLFMMNGTSLDSFSVPIRPRRCDHLRLRIEGNGDAKIYSICKTIERGGN